jgi:hypothetical protein
MSILDSKDEDATLIRRAFDAAGRYFNNGVWFVGAVGVVSLVISLARQIWFLAAISLALFGGISWGLSTLARKYRDPTRSPVLDALLHRPSEVSEIRHHVAQSSTGLFRSEFLHVKLASGERLSLKLDGDDVIPMARLLAARCPNAKMQVDGLLANK